MSRVLQTTPPSLATELVEAIRFLHAQGWTPATSSNFSYRLLNESHTFYVSISGRDKGTLAPEDFLHVDYSGQLVTQWHEAPKPSAETLIHSVIYQNFPEAKLVLHTHSINGTVFSKLYESKGQAILTGFEILKGFEGVKSHDAEIVLPIFPNSQDMPALSQQIDAYLKAASHPVYGFLLAGHGLYTWGDSAPQARRHAEVFEYVMECILKLESYGYFDHSR